MKAILFKKLIVAFPLIANTIFLFSQESVFQKEIIIEGSKCATLIVTPVNQNVASSSGTTSFTVTSNVSWTASSDQIWCTVTPTGTGDGIITATYQANTGSTSRMAVIKVTGPDAIDQFVTVTQSAAPPSLIVTPLNQNVSSSSGTIKFEVISNVAWTTTSDQAWCSVTPSGTGNGTITVAYQVNTGTTSRVATITITGPGVSDIVVTVTQSVPPPSLIVTPLNRYVPSSAGTASFEVTSNVAWTSSSDQAWCSVTSSGTGNGTITAVYQANAGASSRVATITITGSGVSNQVVTVTQDELITISYSGFPWCPSEGVKNVTLSGSPGGTYSAQPEGLDIDPVTGAITPGNSTGGSYTVKYILEKPGENRVVEASTEVAIHLTVTPQIVIKWEDVLICSNVGNLYFGYQWFNGTTPISGASNQYYVTSKIPGVYKAEAIDGHGCKIMSNEISIGSNVSTKVYPNPAISSFKVSINDVPVGNAIIRIINSSGTEVMNLNTEKSDFEFTEEISTSDLEEGFYLVQVTVNGAYLYIVKIMVTK